MEFLVKLLLSTVWARRVPGLRSIWWKLYTYIRKAPTRKIKIKMHGYNVAQPSGYSYAFTSRLFKDFNNPIIECVYQTYNAAGKKISVVDIGAAIGDTVLLLKANCPEMINEYYCIDGDEEFFGYLVENMKRFSDVTSINKILSDSHSSVASLVRTHAGTASAQGEDKVDALSFDEVVQSNSIHDIGVLKIDVDGFDGNVLKGSTNIIQAYKPTVIFEWHPKLYAQAKTDVLAPFEVLHQAGYRNFIWFTKHGAFSHFSKGFDPSYIQQFADICLFNSSDSDWHYDIVSFHPDNNLSILEFANSDFSKRKVSSF